jgi:hypothetical protein
VKDGDHEVASNNRPISLLAIASKVCEKLFSNNSVASYLISKNLLSPHQSGNKKLHSTETLNIFSTDTMLEAIAMAMAIFHSNSTVVYKLLVRSLSVHPNQLHPI